jgi:hypothetical protein
MEEEGIQLRCALPQAADVRQILDPDKTACDPMQMHNIGIQTPDGTQQAAVWA